MSPVGGLLETTVAVFGLVQGVVEGTEPLVAHPDRDRRRTCGVQTGVSVDGAPMVVTKVRGSL